MQGAVAFGSRANIFTAVFFFAVVLHLSVTMIPFSRSSLTYPWHSLIMHGEEFSAVAVCVCVLDL